MSTNNLLAIVEDMTYDELLEATGQSTVKTTQLFSQLRINTFSEDDDGNKLPVGTYSVYVPDEKSAVYAKTVEFRPFMQVYQYRIYDEKKKEFSNRSIMFKGFNDEKFDEKGGLACGKVFKNKIKELTEEELAAQKKIRCRRLMFGLVNIEGELSTRPEDKEPRKLKLENHPVMWATAGQSFMPLGEAIDKLTQKKLLMFNHTLALSSRREKNGATVYYIVQAEPVIQNPPLPLSKENIVTLRQFQDFINSENSVIIEKWKKVHAKKATANKDIDLVAELSPPKDDDMDMGLGNILGAG